MMTLLNYKLILGGVEAGEALFVITVHEIEIN